MYKLTIIFFLILCISNAGLAQNDELPNILWISWDELLDVAEPGKYSFELRRWPKETNAVLKQSKDSGRSFPLKKGRIYLTGEAEEFLSEKEINDSDLGCECRPEERTSDFTHMV